VKRAIVVGLERACTLLDRVPHWNRTDRAWYPSCLGCVLGLAALSDRLDEHWGTRVWWTVEGQ
jgi:hypothetical protein